MKGKNAMGEILPKQWLDVEKSRRKALFGRDCPPGERKMWKKSKKPEKGVDKWGCRWYSIKAVASDRSKRKQALKKL